jgi:hypothetical protein
MSKHESSNQNQSQESRWDRAYHAIEEARSSGEKLDEAPFKDLTKSVGGK